VRNVAIAGPKFDLCRIHRIAMLITCGVAPALAEKYQLMVDVRIGVRGNMPALSTAVSWTPGEDVPSPALEAEGDVSDPDSGEEVTDDPPAGLEADQEAELAQSAPSLEEETQGETRPKRSRSAKP
jgi:hypothetical protein